mmetsp:Transcript_2458/g.7850  ORF Transcript_2458/g.7850 Transcript_2458/m.7850 type:complete len:193 (+) Transcript_2458:299-877(+)
MRGGPAAEVPTPSSCPGEYVPAFHLAVAAWLQTPCSLARFDGVEVDVKEVKESHVLPRPLAFLCPWAAHQKRREQLFATCTCSQLSLHMPLRETSGLTCGGGHHYVDRSCLTSLALHGRALIQLYADAHVFTDASALRTTSTCGSQRGRHSVKRRRTEITESQSKIGEKDGALRRRRTRSPRNVVQQETLCC